MLTAYAYAQSEQNVLPLRFPTTFSHPQIAATPIELERVRSAWKTSGEEYLVLKQLVDVVDRKMGQELTFPPRGGQHNQWYQCADCQRPLRTVDSTHHECRQCGKIYSGEPYDDVLFGRIHAANLQSARQAAWVYAFTREPKYARFVARVLMGYAERYKSYPYHDSRAGTQPPGRSGGHLFEQTLNEASHMAANIAPAFDLVYPALNQSQRELIRAGLIAPMVENIAKYRVGKSNWQSFHNAALFWGGCCLGEPKFMHQAITADGHGFLSQMIESVTADGMWYENSWAYHYYTLRALVPLAEGSRRLGIDLWSHAKFQRMFTLGAEYAMADGSLPRFGDDVNSRADRAQESLEAAFHAYRDPRILSLLSMKPSLESILLGRKAEHEASKPESGSKIFAAAGHAILRTQGPAGLTAAFTFSPFGGAHGHFDKLSFVFFGYGRELGVDPGRARSQAYGLPVHSRWYRATISHNSVVVDRESQVGASGTLESFGATSQFAAVRARTTAAYPGIDHVRTLVLTPEYLLVFDELEATDERPRRFDWFYHHRSPTVSSSEDLSDAMLADYPGAEFIDRLKAGESDTTVRVQFENKDITTWLTSSAHDETGVLIGDGVGATMDDRVPLAMLTRHGQKVLFATVIEPVKAGTTRSVEDVLIETRGSHFVLTVRRGGTSDVVSIEDPRIVVMRDSERVLEAGRWTP